MKKNGNNLLAKPLKLGKFILTAKQAGYVQVRAGGRKIKPTKTNEEFLASMNK